MRVSENKKIEKLFNFRPMFFLAVSLCLGIFFAFSYKLYDASLWWLCILPLIIGASFCFCGTKRSILKAMAWWGALCLFFAFGFLGFSAQVRHFEKTRAYNGEYAVVGKVVEKKKSNYYTYLLLDDVFMDGKGVNGKLNAYLPLSFYENVDIGNAVVAFGEVGTNTEIIGEYGFRAYEIGEDIKYSCYAGDCTVADTQTELFLWLRNRIQTRIDGGMDEGGAAVMTAVLMGNTSQMDRELLDNMRYGGIAHIFAVSGLHVGALYAFCLLLFRKTKLGKMPKVGKVVLLAFILLVYGGICGFSPSIIRAVVLCLVSYVAKQFLSSVDVLETLGFSAIVILFLSPVDLFDVGFQLSFSACLGIVLLQKRVGQVCVEIGKIYRKAFPKKLTEEQKSMVENGDTLPKTLFERVAGGSGYAFSVSLAAQIATAPIQLAHFGYISGWGLLLNVLFVPIITAAFAFLLVFAVIACLLPVGASFAVLYIPNVFWSAVLLLFEVVDFSSFALVGWQVSSQACVCYYGGCVFATDKLYLSAFWKRVGAAVCFSSFIFLFLMGNL